MESNHTVSHFRQFRVSRHEPNPVGRADARRAIRDHDATHQDGGTSSGVPPYASYSAQTLFDVIAEGDEPFTEGILANAQAVDNPGTRRRKVRELLFEQVGIADRDELFREHEILWRGRRRGFQEIIDALRRGGVPQRGLATAQCPGHKIHRGDQVHRLRSRQPAAQNGLRTIGGPPTTGLTREQACRQGARGIAALADSSQLQGACVRSSG